MGNILYMVIPCYNEEEVLDKTARELKRVLEGLIKKKRIDKRSKIVFVDDGSTDRTCEIIEELIDGDKLYGLIKLSRNRGHQNALLAGLMVCKDKADMVISMDADLQDDIMVIGEMVDKYIDGYDIVYGVRESRKKDSWFKRNSALLFYKFMLMMGVDIVYNHADFRLMSKRSIEALGEFREVNLFLRGMVPLVGFKSTKVFYERGEREAGESKYSLKKMMTFALEGITSFSIKPLRMILGLGVVVLIISMIIMIYSLVVKLLGNTVDGWTFIIISIWFIGGLQMVSLGIIGEYIGRVYSEAKDRPRYIIDRIRVGDDK